MSTAQDELSIAFELHSVERVRSILDAGLDVRVPIDGKLPIDLLIEMYTRSDRFPACLKLLLDRGAELGDPLLAAVLLDDAALLSSVIVQHPRWLPHRVDLVSAFTPLRGATLLHVAAEYGHLAVARRLIELGADVDAPAALDADGMNGHSPLFHTVNSNANRSAPLMRLLLEAGARTDILLRGITWGSGFDWETTCFDVTPIVYAQFGLLPQMHRDERDVYANVATLLRAAGREVPPLGNVPNRYLHPDEHGSR